MFKIVLITNNVFMIVKNYCNPRILAKPLEVYGFIHIKTFENGTANESFFSLRNEILNSGELGRLASEAKKIALNKK